MLVLRRTLALLAVTAAVAAATWPIAAAAPPAAAPDGTRHVVVLHTNDLHGQVRPLAGTWIDAENPPPVGGLPTVAAYIRRAREECEREGAIVLVLDAGDTFQGTPEGDLTNGRLVFDFFAALRYDAVAIGNHEYDRGVEALRARSHEAPFPMLAANIIEDATGGLPDYARPFAMIRRGGLAFGIVGLTTSEMRRISLPGPIAGLSFEDEAVAARRFVPDVRRRGADLAFLLTHAGVDRDRRLALEVPGVDAIVGGHSHTGLDQLVFETGLPIVQTGSRSTRVGRLDLEWDPVARRVVRASSRLTTMLVSEWGEDAEVRAIAARYAPAIEEVMSVRLGALETPLRRVPGHTSSALGNQLCDLMRAAGETEIAFHNKTGIRADMEAGPVTVRSVYEVSPFDNTVVRMTLRGSELREALERSLEHPSLSLEVSGLRVVFDLARPVGERVVEATVGGRPLQPDRTYTVATNSFIAGGGDGHRAFATGGDRADTHVLLRDAHARLFRERGVVRVELEERLVPRQ